MKLVDKDNRDVCGLSAIDPRPSIRTMLKDAATGLVKQVLPSKNICANGVVVSWCPGEGRTALQTIVLPRFCSSSSSSRGVSRGSPCSGATNAARSRRSSYRQPTAAAAAMSSSNSSSRAAAEQQQQQ